MYRTTTTTQDGAWYPPAGHWNATLSQVKVDADNPDQVRLIFKVPLQPGLTREYAAGKTYKKEQHRYLLADLHTWLGKERIEALSSDEKLPFANLESLVGECAVLEVELKDCGKSQAFRNIRSIHPCRAYQRETSPAVNVPGIDLRALNQYPF